MAQRLQILHYATWWIRQAITRGLGNNGKTIRLPVHMVDVVRTVQDTRQSLHDKYHRRPDARGDLEASGLDTERSSPPSRHRRKLSPWIGRWARTAMPHCRISSRMRPRSTPRPGRRRGAGPAHQGLQILDPEEQQVLWLRFGLDGDEPWTLSDVGKVINSTRDESVRSKPGVGQTAPSQLRHRPASPALTVADDERVVAHAAHDRAPFPLCADTSAGTSSSKRLLSRNTDSHFAQREPEADYLSPLISLECEEIGFLVPTFGAGESDGKIHH